MVKRIDVYREPPPGWREFNRTAGRWRFDFYNCNNDGRILMPPSPFSPPVGEKVSLGQMAEDRPLTSGCAQLLFAAGVSNGILKS
jgi:hypothetical protein